MPNGYKRLTLFVCILISTACATTQGRYTVIDASYPARSENCQVKVLTDAPKNPFKKISRLDVHLEKTHFIGSSLEDALPEITKQACLSGADAVIDLEERSSSVGETQIYHVTAIGIRYSSELEK